MNKLSIFLTAAFVMNATAVEALRKVIELCDENGGIFAVVEFE